jgi:putative sterol carrier protein
MAAFSGSDDLHSIMQELWEAIRQDNGMSTKLLSSKLVVQFHYREPDGLITIDVSDGENFKIFTGDNDLKPEVEMFMRSDIAHEFWTGKTSMPVAILTGKIVAKGPVSKALALLPVIKPAFEIYPNIYRARREKVSV